MAVDVVKHCSDVLGYTKSTQSGIVTCCPVTWEIAEIAKLHQENTVHADGPLPFAENITLRQNAVDGFLYVQTKTNSVASVCERTITSERPPLVGKVSANVCK
jgi:hypothetical protein